MDLHNFLYQSLIVSVVTIALIRVVLKLFLTRPPPKVRLPPGPWKLPVIGSVHHLVNALPHHRVLRDLARVHGPLMMLQLGETLVVVVSSKEMARMVLKTHDANFATRPKLLGGDIVLYGWSDIVFSPSGEYWRKLRQLCAAELLSLKRVLTFRQIREQEIATVVARIRAAGPSTPVELSAMLDHLANNIVARASFGNVHRRNTDKFLSAIRAGAMLTSGFTVPDLFPTWRPVLAAVTGMRRALEQVHSTVDSTLDEIIEERKRIRGNKRQGEEDENLVDVLLSLQESSIGGLGFHLTENSIKSVLFDMMFAGSGSVGSSLIWGMAELMRNERVMRKLQGEIRQAFHGKAVITEADIEASISSRSLPYLKLVIKETLRLHPAAPLLVPRESIQSCEIEGYTIPARSRVLVNVWAIARDPKCWGDDADELKPERFDEDAMVDFNGSCYEYLPFGAGRRICPGIAYTLPVMEIVLVQLLYHFDWSLPDGVSELDMAEVRGLGARRKSPLLLCATPFVVPKCATSYP